MKASKSKQQGLKHPIRGTKSPKYGMYGSHSCQEEDERMDITLKSVTHPVHKGAYKSSSNQMCLCASSLLHPSYKTMSPFVSHSS